MERVWQRNYANHAEAKLDVANFIAGFYNCERLHSVLGNLPPSVYERTLAAKETYGGVRNYLTTTDHSNCSACCTKRYLSEKSSEKFITRALVMNCRPLTSGNCARDITHYCTNPASPVEYSLTRGERSQVQPPPLLSIENSSINVSIPARVNPGIPD
jgi:hypothetical protein